MVRMVALAVWLTLAVGPALAVEEVDLVFDDHPAPDSYGVTVKAVVNAPPLAVRHALLRSCDFRRRYSFMDECKVFAVKGDTAWSYTLLDPPVVSPRDYVVVRHVLEDFKPDGTGEMHMSFTHDHSVGPLPRSGVVRVMVNAGSWDLVPRAGGRKTHITYHLMVNPGGRIPLWMARLAARRATPAQLGKVESIAKDLMKERKVLVPVPGAPFDGVTPVPLGLPARPMPAP